MQAGVRYSTCAATAACATATGGMLIIAEVGLATDVLPTVAAMTAGIPWPLAFHWQPGILWLTAFCTVLAIAANVALLWKLGGKLPH